MKSSKTKSTKFDAVEKMRQIRDKIDKETAGMNFEQLKKYYSESRKENKDKASR
ncbi:MAG: hypothetical protein ACOCWM_06130 [Cyclobacteriaceae bacterium]